MKILIAGSRTIDKYRALYEFFLIFDHLPEITGYITGDCPKRADQVPYLLKSLGDKTPILPFPADWETHGKAAGPIRNRKMAQEADILVLIWDGKSKGSANMKKEANKLGKLVIEAKVF